MHTLAFSPKDSCYTLQSRQNFSAD